MCYSSYKVERNKIPKKAFNNDFYVMLHSNIFINMFFYLKITPSKFEKNNVKK